MKYIMDCYESVSGFLSSLCPKKKGENVPQNNFKLSSSLLNIIISYINMH